MKTWRTAACCGLAMAFLCVGARRVRAESPEDAVADAGQRFDGSANRAQDPAEAPDGGSENSFSHAGNKLMKTLGRMPQTIQDNAVPLGGGAALGALIGVGVGSFTPAGPVIGGILGAALGAGAGMVLMGDDEGSKLGKVLTSTAVGAIAGMSFGLCFPIVGPLIGGIAGAVFGAAAGLYLTS